VNATPNGGNRGSPARSSKVCVRTSSGAFCHHIAEVDLCQCLNVSRMPVREALIKRVEDGQVHIYPQLGSFASPISIEAVRERQYVREHLECAIIADTAL
jgi:hypothetical protein